jgi:hypothetical protein
LDELLRDHFLQCILKLKLKQLGITRMLSVVVCRTIFWGGKEGQAHFEFEMAHRLHIFESSEKQAPDRISCALAPYFSINLSLIDSECWIS